MPATEARIGYGSKFSIENDDTPGTYDELAEVVSITPPSDSVDMIDATHMQSPGRYREFIPGLIDPGECSIEMNYVPGGLTDVRLRQVKTDGVVKSYRITYPNGATHTFRAFLMTYQPNDPLEDKMTATAAFRVTGPVVAGPPSP